MSEGPRADEGPPPGPLGGPRAGGAHPPSVTDVRNNDSRREWSSDRGVRCRREQEQMEETADGERWALDLFSGTGSVKAALERRGWKVISVDMDPKFGPDVVADIREWKYQRDLPRSKYRFDLIAASPPCTEYSRAMTARPRRMLEADELVAQERRIVDYYRPRVWWIENPRNGNLQWRQVVSGLRHIDIDYCRFTTEWGYNKPTRFWVADWMADQLESVVCRQDCGNIIEDDHGRLRHRVQLGGTAKGGVQRQGNREQLYRIPDAVIGYLVGDKVETTVERKAINQPHVREIVLQAYHQAQQTPFRIGMMEHRGTGHQLLLNVTVRTGGVSKRLQALVDTGAQVNLIRPGAVPDSCFVEARKPLLLKTASGEELRGGQRVANLQIQIAAETEDGKPAPQPWASNIIVHDGDVGVDMILGYPWLQRNKVDIQPWRNALQLHQAPRWILRAHGNRGNDNQVGVRTVEAETINDTTEAQKLQPTLVAEVNLETGEVVEEAIEDTGTLDEMAYNIDMGNACVRGIVVAEDAFPGETAASARKHIEDRFRGSVFRDTIWPNPPARGTHGKAQLHLKEGAVPVVSRTIHVHGERLTALKQLEEEWKRDQKIEPGRGPWRAAAFPIKKKSGKWRGVCDYALTNKMIHPDSYPLPLTEDITAEMAACELFTTLDLRDAFHQVALHEDSRWVTCIQLPGGLWQWRVVPQGINVGPALLQRDIDATCKPVEDVARPYFDDIIIGTKREPNMTDDEMIKKHLEGVTRVLDRLAADMWVASKDKARLLMSRVEFCGHLLGGGKRVPAPGKLAAVQHWAPPPTVTAMRGFLGLCNYYSHYVRMFAEYAAPLQDKLKLPRELGKAGSKHKLKWTAEDLKAFARLKEALVADLELHHIDSRKPFALRTDASQYAIGAALEQFPKIDGVPTLDQIKPGASVPVGFMSRKLTVGQRDRWDTRDKETYAVVSGLERWAGHIGYNQVLILTDHKSLESWHKEYIAGMGPTGRRARWHSKLNKFRIEVVHIPGSSNIVSDALSRWAYPASTGYEDTSWHGTEQDTTEMKEHLEAERQRERETPKARHPLDVETEPQPQQCSVATITMTDGTPATILTTPSGRKIEMAWVQFEESPEMDRRIAAVTRAQARQPRASDGRQQPTVEESDGSERQQPTARRPDKAVQQRAGQSREEGERGRPTPRRGRPPKRPPATPTPKATPTSPAAQATPTSPSSQEAT